MAGSTHSSLGPGKAEKHAEGSLRLGIRTWSFVPRERKATAAGAAAGEGGWTKQRKGRGKATKLCFALLCQGLVDRVRYCLERRAGPKTPFDAPCHFQLSNSER